MTTPRFATIEDLKRGRRNEPPLDQPVTSIPQGEKRAFDFYLRSQGVSSSRRNIIVNDQKTDTVLYRQFKQSTAGFPEGGFTGPLDPAFQDFIRKQERAALPTTTSALDIAQGLGRLARPPEPTISGVPAIAETFAGLTGAQPSRVSALAEVGAIDLTGEVTTEGGDTQFGFDTFDEAFGSLPNENWEVYKNEFGKFDVRRKQAAAPLPTGLSPFQIAEQERASEQARLTADFREAEAGRAAEAARLTSEFRGDQLGFQQEQARLGAEEQERQFRSQLAANPINWLQYAAYTGEPPVIQPWMVPLGFQNQGGIAPQGQAVPQGQLQPGQVLPGFDGQQGQRDFQSFSNLPALTTPSAQLQARWGPTAQAQFLGFRQARTGASPQETQFRLGSGRAPTGINRGFSSFR